MGCNNNSCGKDECCGGKHCGECSEHSCCQNQSCECPCSCCQGKEKECNFAKELLELADCAWMEALKEKIKENILKKDAENLNKLAELVSESNGQRWKHKMGEKRSKKEFKEKLNDHFKKK